MAEKSSGDTSSKRMKNPLLCSTVTGLSIDDFIQNAVLMPVHPAEHPAELHDDLRNRPPRSVSTTISAVRNHAEIEPSTFTTYRNTAPPSRTNGLNSNLDQIDLNTKAKEDDFDIDSFYSRLHTTPNLNNEKREDTNEEFSEIDLLSTSSDSRVFEEKENLSMAADFAQNLSQLPNVFPHVANTVFNSFSSIWNMNRSHVSTVSDAGRHVEIFEENRVEIGEDLRLEGARVIESVPLFDTASFSGVGNRKSSIHAMVAKDDAMSRDVVDGKFDDTKEMVTLDSRRDSPGAATSSDVGAGNRYRFGSKKKKTYAHVPGLVLGETEYQYQKPQASMIGLPPIPPLPTGASRNNSAYNHNQPPMLNPSVLPSAPLQSSDASTSSVDISYQNITGFSGDRHSLKEDKGNIVLQPFVVESNLPSQSKIESFLTSDNIVSANESMTNYVRNIDKPVPDMCRVVEKPIEDNIVVKKPTEGNTVAEKPTEENVIKLPIFISDNKSNVLTDVKDSTIEKEQFQINKTDQYLQSEQNVDMPVFFDPGSNVTTVPPSDLPPRGNAYRGAPGGAYGQKSNLSVKNFYSLLKKNSMLTGTNQEASSNAFHNLNHPYDVTASSYEQPVAIFNPLVNLEPSKEVTTVVGNMSLYQPQSTESFSESAKLNQDLVNPSPESKQKLNASLVIEAPLFFNPESYRESSNNVLTSETHVLNYASDPLQSIVNSLSSENTPVSVVQGVDVQPPMFYNPSSLPQSQSLSRESNSCIILPQVQHGPQSSLQSHESLSVSNITKPPSNLTVPVGPPLALTPPVAPPTAFSNQPAESGNRFRLSNNKKRLQYYSGPVDSSALIQNAPTPVQAVAFQGLQESSVSLLTPSNDNSFSNLASNFASSFPLGNDSSHLTKGLSSNDDYSTSFNRQYDGASYQAPNPQESNDPIVKTPSTFLGFTALGKIQEKVNLNNIQKVVTSFFDANYYEQKEKEDKQFKASHGTSEQPNDSVLYGSHLQDSFVQQSFEYDSSQLAPAFYNPNQFNQQYSGHYSEIGNQNCNNADEDVVKIPTNDFYGKSVQPDVTSNQFQYISDVHSNNPSDLAQHVPSRLNLPPSMNFFDNFTGSSFNDNVNVVKDSGVPTNNDFYETNNRGNSTSDQSDLRRKSMSPRTASYESDPFFLDGPQYKNFGKHHAEHGEIKNDGNISVETPDRTEPSSSMFGLVYPQDKDDNRGTITEEYARQSKNNTAEEHCVRQSGLQISAKLDLGEENNNIGSGSVDLWSPRENRTVQRIDVNIGAECINVVDINENRQNLMDEVKHGRKTMAGASSDVDLPEYPSSPDENQNVIAHHVDRSNYYRPQAEMHPVQNKCKLKNENICGFQNPVHQKNNRLVVDEAETACSNHSMNMVNINALDGDRIDPKVEEFRLSLESQFGPPHLMVDPNVYGERRQGGQDWIDPSTKERRLIERIRHEAEHSKLLESGETSSGEGGLNKAIEEQLLIEMLSRETPQKMTENQPKTKSADSSIAVRNEAYERQLLDQLRRDTIESNAADKFFDGLNSEENNNETEEDMVQSIHEDLMITQMMQRDVLRETEQLDQLIGTFKNIIVKEVQRITPNRDALPRENNLMYTIEPIGIDSDDEDHVYENVPINRTEPGKRGSQVNALKSYFPESQFDTNASYSNNHFHQSVLNRALPFDQQSAAFVPIRTVSPRTSAPGHSTDQNASIPSADNAMGRSSGEQHSLYDYPKTWDEHFHNTDSFGVPLAYIQQQLPYNPATVNLDSGIREMYSSSLPSSSQDAQDGSCSSQNLEYQRNISVSLQVVRGRSKSSSSDNDEGNFLRVTAEEELLPTTDIQSKNEHAESINVALFMQSPVAIPSFFDTENNDVESLVDNDLIEEEKQIFEERGDFTNDCANAVIEENIEFKKGTNLNVELEGLNDNGNTDRAKDVNYGFNDYVEESQCLEMPAVNVHQLDDVFKEVQDVEDVQQIDLIDKTLGEDEDGIEKGVKNVEDSINVTCHDSISSVNESAEQCFEGELNDDGVQSLNFARDNAEISLEKTEENENLVNKSCIGLFENTVADDYQCEDILNDIRANTEEFCSTASDTGLLEASVAAGHQRNSDVDSETNLLKYTDKGAHQEIDKNLIDSAFEKPNDTIGVPQVLEVGPAISSKDVSSKNETEQNSVPLFNAFSFGFDNQQSFFNDFGSDSDKKSKNTSFTNSKRHDDSLVQSFHSKKDDTRPVGVAQPYLYNNQSQQSSSQSSQSIDRAPVSGNVTNATYFYPVAVSNRPNFANEQDYLYRNVQYQNQAQQPEFYMVRHTPIISNHFQEQPQMMQGQFLHYQQQQQQQGTDQAVVQSNYNQNLPFNSNPIPSVYNQIPANSNQIQRNNNFTFPNVNDVKNCRQYFN